MSLVIVSLKLYHPRKRYPVFSKNCEFDIVLTRTVNILTTNELAKLTMLCTTGPWYIYVIIPDLHVLIPVAQEKYSVSLLK